MSDITKEIEKRRTFAIISHPDAGKTTLTEKFLLYGGAINQAGSVKGKATDAATTDKVKVVAEAPKDSLAEPAIYPVGVVSASKHKDAAEKFVEFLQSEEALKVFESYGFQKNAE